MKTRLAILMTAGAVGIAPIAMTMPSTPASAHFKVQHAEFGKRIQLARSSWSGTGA